MVSPDQIDIRHQLCDSFGKAEIEFVAMAVIEFCQLRRQGWAPLDAKQILDFIKARGHQERHFGRLVVGGHITLVNGKYMFQQSFIDRCYRSSLVVESLIPDGKNITANGKHVGRVSMSPDDHRVMNPGKWDAVIHLADEGITSLGVFDTEKEALEAALDGLVKNWTYEQWADYWQWSAV